MADLDDAHELVSRHGAALLADSNPHRVYADVVGHPFCLYPGGTASVGRIARVVFDCFSPRALAASTASYSTCVFDGSTSLSASSLPHATAAWRLRSSTTVSPAPRWPDPDYPQQPHLDLVPDDPRAAVQLAARLGAMRLPLPPKQTVWADPSGHPFCLLRT